MPDTGATPDTGAAPPPPVAVYLGNLVEALRGHVTPAMRDFDETAVHQARVATRRLSAAMELLEPLFHRHDYKDLGRVLKKLRKRLGPHRDLDVLIGYVDEFGADERFTTAAAAVSRHLRSERSTLRREAAAKDRVGKTLERVARFDIVTESLTAHREGVLPLLAEGIHTYTDEFAALADILTAFHQSRLERKRSDGSVGAEMLSMDPHELRIAGKHLRYSLELADANGVKGISGTGGLLKTFKQMQDDLGLWHDYVVLGDTIVELLAKQMVSHRDASMASQMMGLGAECLGRAQEKLEHFTRLWSEKGAAMTAAIRQSLPLTREVATHPSEWPEEKRGVVRRDASNRLRSRPRNDRSTRNPAT
jgi:CHAD domain-containing protein